MTIFLPLIISSLISIFVCFIGAGVYFARKKQCLPCVVRGGDENSDDEYDTFDMRVSRPKELDNTETEKLDQALDIQESRSKELGNTVTEKWGQALIAGLGWLSNPYPQQEGDGARAGGSFSIGSGGSSAASEGIISVSSRTSFGADSESNFNTMYSI